MPVRLGARSLLVGASAVVALFLVPGLLWAPLPLMRFVAASIAAVLPMQLGLEWWLRRRFLALTKAK